MLNFSCENCPRLCKNRPFCGKSQDKIRVAKVMRHFFEEPPICPKDKGSGAVFFSFCSLKCVFCQNYNISHEGQGKDLSIEQLVEIFKKIDKSTVANLNLVTPTHYADKIITALKNAKMHKPVVWNSSGYERAQTIEKLRGLVDVFLLDCKYYDNKIAIKYSKANGYFDYFIDVYKKAREIVGEDIYENGEMKKGIIVRHLVLPNNYKDSINIFKNIKEKLGNKMCISVMSQYTPVFNAKDYEEINRRLHNLEYKKVLNEIEKMGFKNGFIQDLTSASCDYTPDFSLEKFDELN